MMAAASTKPIALKRKVRTEPEQLTARFVRFKRNYFISRHNTSSDALVDDEATLVIDAVIEEISPRHQHTAGLSMEIWLLCARVYADEPSSETRFFGSVTLRGKQRSALAYLPDKPFWNFPDLIREGASLFEFRFTPLIRGYGDLLSLFLGYPEDIQELRALSRGQR